MTADGYEVFLGGDENVLKRTVSDGGTTLNRLKVTGSYTSTGRIVPNVNYTSIERLLKATRTPAANCKPASCPTPPLAHRGLAALAFRLFLQQTELTPEAFALAVP